MDNDTYQEFPNALRAWLYLDSDCDGQSDDDADPDHAYTDTDTNCDSMDGEEFSRRMGYAAQMATQRYNERWAGSPPDFLARYADRPVRVTIKWTHARPPTTDPVVWSDDATVLALWTGQTL